MKQCKTCRHWKPRGEFYSHLDTADRLTPNCKLCHNRLRGEARARRIEHWRAYDRARRKELTRKESRADYQRMYRLRKKQTKHITRLHSMTEVSP